MTKILVTGANGHIGANVVREAIRLGHEIVPMVRKGADVRGLHGLDLEPVYADVLDASAVRAVFDTKPDAVIHLAQPYSLEESDPDSMLRPAVEGTENVFRAMKDAGVHRVVHASSNAAVGLTDDPDKPLDETSFRTSSEVTYIESKIRGERRATELAKELGVDAIIALPVAVFGRWDFKVTPTTQSIYDAVNGTGPMPFAVNATDVRDIGIGHVLALEKGTPGERYLIGADVALPEQIADILEDLTGKRPATKLPPLPVLNVLLTVLGWFGKAPTTKVAINDVYGKHFAYDTSKARRELGFQPRSTRECLTDTLRWGAFMKAFKPAMNVRLEKKLPPEPEWVAAVASAP